MYSIQSNFWDLAVRQPDCIALVAELQALWTAAHLLVECNRISNGLRELGLRNGDIVAVLMPGCGQLLATVLATCQTGMRTLLLNPRFTPDELAYLLNDSGAKALIFHDTVATPEKI